MNTDDRAPGSITARLNLRAFARRQLQKDLLMSALFAFTVGFVAPQSFGPWLPVVVGAVVLAAGAALARVRYSAAQKPAEGDFDSIREVAAASGGVTTPEERLEALESVRFLVGDGEETRADAASRPSRPD